jgi:hypothetical protein
MPILGKEEPATLQGQFSNNNAGAGIPIKKRRFPMFPPSPPRQESAPPPVKNDPIVSNSAETVNAVKNTLLEVKKEVVVDPSSKLISTIGGSGNLNVSVAKLNEPNSTTSQSNIVANNVANMGGNVTSNLGSLKCKPEPVASNDALGSKEPLIPALTGQNKESGQPTLFLSLSKENSVDQSKTADETINNDTVVSLNRANWDLNTTMDDWDGSSGNAPSLDTVGFNGLSKIDSGKQIVGSGECRRDFPASSLPSTQYKAEDLLNLSLSPSFTRTNFNINPSGSSANMPFGSSSSMPFASSTVLTSGSFSKLNSVLTANHPSSSSSNIASSSLSKLAGSSSSVSSGSSSNLPSGSSANIPFSLAANMNLGSSARVSSMMAVEYSKLVGQVPIAAASTMVKKELVEGCTVPNAISKNVVENRPIKSEPVQDINKVTPRFTESMMNSLARTVLHSQEHAFLATKTTSMLEISSSSGLPSSSSSGLSSNSDVSNQEHSVKVAATTLLEKSPLNVTEFQNSCEKNTISTHMTEKDPSGSGCESEGRVKKGAGGGKEDEDYEDGEVREFLLQSAALKIPTNEKEDIPVDCVGEAAENSNLSSLGLIDNVILNQDPVEDKDREDVISEDHSKECIDNGVEDGNDQILDEIQEDSPVTLVRERFQDQSFRGSRMRFARGRGRAYNRFDRGEWNSSDRKFNSENYNGPSEYNRFSRNRQSSAGDEEFESDGYQEGNLVASGRGGGRKPLSDDFPSFRNHNMRRVSPRGRGGSPSTRGIQMVRRVSRNISPNGDNKYNRSFPEDDEPMFARYQNSNDGADDQFPRNNRKFAFVQRRGIHPRVRSKSPIRTRMRSSPGPWTSPPRRRSPDSFNRLPRQQRSPPMYRMERVRSPPLNFPNDVVSRRRGSPPYISRPSNDFQRPMPNRRSPSDFPLPRNHRRFDNSSDLPERTTGGKFYDGPIRASRFDEIDEEGTGGDDRRRMNERRGGRSFNGENFRFRRQDNGPRPFRFGPKSDSEFVERHNKNNSNNNNLRDREFDRRIKNRPVIAPNRRVRAGEDDEGDFRQGGPVWQDESFSDDYRGKRRRF